MITRIHQIALKSENPEQSRQFYKEVIGARFMAMFNPPGLLFFEFNGTRLLLEKSANTGALYFRVGDIEAAYARLQTHGIAFESDIQTIFKDEGLNEFCQIKIREIA